MKTTPMQTATTLRVYADCPYCEFSGAVSLADGWYDNQWNGGQGGYRVTCPSCGTPYAITADIVYDLQYAARVLLGEGDPKEWAK